MNNIVLFTELLDHRQELIACRYSRQALADRIDQHGGEFTRILVENPACNLRLIERNNDNVIQYALWCAF